MASTIDAPSTGEIWHLTIEDLLAPLPETARLGGSGPFVINLSASSAPIDVPAKGIAGCQHAHVYQVHRTEDRRVRYRLRLGPFATEDEADDTLKKVRDDYPSALTATADAEDMRALATLRAKSPMPHPPASKPADTATPIPASTEATPVPAAASTLIRAVVQAPSVPPAGRPAVSAPVSRPTPARAPSAPTSRLANQADQRVPSLETTQTVRALTQLELEDNQASRWFAVQLSVAEEAFDPETVPNLDIFTVYRLYSVAGIDQGRIVHALRLGFFSEQSAAGAVASYLTAFYEKPSIKRVSSAERERFAEQSIEPRKDVGATGRQAVIEITNERYIREKRVGQAAPK